jgi:serine/threonine-protein kinase HipA
VLAEDESLVYWIKRFDRVGQKEKLAVEDFGQLLEKDRETKYEGSMEQLVEVIDEFCTFPAVEKKRFFLRTLFCWLVGNEDMHLKNWSVITKEGKVTLSPAYDLLNSALALDTDREMALPLKGKRNNFKKEILLDYWGKERLGLTDKVVKQTCQQLSDVLPRWESWIYKSFLPEDWKDAYWKGMQQRANILGLI